MNQGTDNKKKIEKSVASLNLWVREAVDKPVEVKVKREVRGTCWNVGGDNDC